MVNGGRRGFVYKLYSSCRRGRRRRRSTFDRSRSMPDGWNRMGVVVEKEEAVGVVMWWWWCKEKSTFSGESRNDTKRIQRAADFLNHFTRHQQQQLLGDLIIHLVGLHLLLVLSLLPSSSLLNTQQLYQVQWQLLLCTQWQCNKLIAATLHSRKMAGHSRWSHSIRRTWYTIYMYITRVLRWPQKPKSWIRSRHLQRRWTVVTEVNGVDGWLDGWPHTAQHSSAACYTVTLYYTIDMLARKAPPFILKAYFENDCGRARI